MTTKFLDMAFPTKNSVLDDFPLCPPLPPPPQSRKFYFYCLLAVSEYRARPFRDSIAEGSIAPMLPCFHVVSRKNR